MEKAWENFIEGYWQKDVDVEDFIRLNFKSYDGDDSFLAPISKNTAKVWERCEELLTEERRLGVLDIEMDSISGINNFKPNSTKKNKGIPTVDKNNKPCVQSGTSKLKGV